jgi:hypothetical protein
MSVDVGQETALNLWRRWFEWSGEPVYYRDGVWPGECYFCGEEEKIGQKGIKHSDSCVWVLAKKLIEETHD